VSGKINIMSTTTFIAIYFLIWWVTLFAVLPFGVRVRREIDHLPAGADPGAPAMHRVGRMIFWNSLVAGVVFCIFYAVYVSGVIPYDWITAIATPPKR
jgi:predicted secreted protein